MNPKDNPKLAWVNPYWTEFLEARARAIVAMRACGNSWDEIADQLDLDAEQAEHIYGNGDALRLCAPKDN